MIEAITRSARDGVARLGLADTAFQIYGNASRLSPRSFISNAKFRRTGAPDGLPIPPPDLIFHVAGTADIAWFLRGGQLAASSIQDALAAHAIQITDSAAILDFGCGCGRVLRNWASLGKTAVHGTDYNPRLIAWCKDNLQFGRYDINRLAPPLDYEGEKFDLIYALSVFTHLTEDLQVAWMRELRRVLQPGGHLLISTHGDAYRHRLTSAQQSAYESGKLVVKNNVKSPGSNTCSAYHPHAYVRDELAAGFDVASFMPEGAKGNPRQDLYLLRKPAA